MIPLSVAPALPPGKLLVKPFWSRPGNYVRKPRFRPTERPVPPARTVRFPLDKNRLRDHQQ